jgi:hypothetical protein
MLATGGYSLDPAKVAHLNRRLAVGSAGAVAQLAIGVMPPGPDRAVGLERQAMIVTSGYGLDPAKVAHLNRRVAGGVGPVAQLAELVRTPRPDRAVGLERQAMEVTSVDALEPAKVAHLHWRAGGIGWRADGGGAQLAVVAQLAKVVITPGLGDRLSRIHVSTTFQLCHGGLCGESDAQQPQDPQ